MNVDSIITLRAIGRSGSLFVQQLFENYSQIVMLPIVFDFYGRWNLLTKTVQSDIAELLRYYTQNTNLKYLLGEKNNLFCWIDDKGNENYISLHREKYLELCISYINISEEKNFRKRFLLALHQAYYKLMGLKWPSQPILLLHEHMPYFFEETDNDFSDSKHLVTLRRPENIYASYSKFFRKDGGVYGPLYLQYSLKVTVEGYINALNYQNRFPEKIFFISTEALNAEPEITINKLCNWFSIKFEDTLLIPTFGGYSGTNNSAFAPQISKFNKEISEKNRFENICSKREITIIQKIFSDLNSRFYQKNSHRSLLLVAIIILMPDIESIFLRKFLIKDLIYYLISLNIVWSRKMFFYCLWITVMNKKTIFYPTDISNEMGYKYKNLLQKVIFFKK